MPRIQYRIVSFESLCKVCCIDKIRSAPLELHRRSPLRSELRRPSETKTATFSPRFCRVGTCTVVAQMAFIFVWNALLRSLQPFGRLKAALSQILSEIWIVLVVMFSKISKIPTLCALSVRLFLLFLTYVSTEFLLLNSQYSRDRVTHSRMTSFKAN